MMIGNNLFFPGQLKKARHRLSADPEVTDPGVERCGDQGGRGTGRVGLGHQDLGDVGVVDEPVDAVGAQQQPIGVVAYAVRTSPTAQCKGLEVLQMDGAGIPSTISCVPLDTSKVTPGTVSIAMIGTQGWLSVGASTWTTDDRKTWTKRG